LKVKKRRLSEEGKGEKKEREGLCYNSLEEEQQGWLEVSQERIQALHEILFEFFHVGNILDHF
jgi:FtsZ-binding cell division protein ZapB